MGISKERLEELIKQEATVYYIKDEEIKEFYLNEDTFIIDNKLYQYDCFIIIDNLFETKEDAEFALKYTNIPRDECLSLPTWEEFCNQKDVEFYTNGIRYELGLWSSCSNEKSIKILWRDTHNEFGEIFNQPLTEENYYKALNVCVKLWEGEE